MAFFFAISAASHGQCILFSTLQSSSLSFALQLPLSLLFQVSSVGRVASLTIILFARSPGTASRSTPLSVPVLLLPSPSSRVPCSVRCFSRTPPALRASRRAAHRRCHCPKPSPSSPLFYECHHALIRFPFSPGYASNSMPLLFFALFIFSLVLSASPSVPFSLRLASATPLLLSITYV